MIENAKRRAESSARPSVSYLPILLCSCRSKLSRQHSAMDFGIVDWKRPTRLDREVLERVEQRALEPSPAAARRQSAQRRSEQRWVGEVLVDCRRRASAGGDRRTRG